MKDEDKMRYKTKPQLTKSIPQNEWDGGGFGQACSSKLSSPADYQLVGTAGEQRCRYQLALFFACNEGVRREQKVQAWHVFPTTETAISLRD